MRKKKIINCVVIPSTLRNINLLKKSITSIRNQSIPIDHLVIVDDSSSQKLNKKIKLNKNEYVVKSKKVFNANIARNLGYDFLYKEVFQKKLSYNIILSFLDDDDIWHKDKILAQNFFYENRQIKIIGTGYKAEPNVLKKNFKKFFIKKLNKKLLFLSNCGIGPQTISMRMEVYKSVQGYDPEAFPHGGRDFFLKLIYKYDIYKIKNRLVYLNQDHGFGRVSDKNKLNKAIFILKKHKKLLKEYYRLCYLFETGYWSKNLFYKLFNFLKIIFISRNLYVILFMAKVLVIEIYSQLRLFYEKYK